MHAVHDVSGGGLAVALAEMAAAAGTGCTVDLDDAAELFTELPSRFVVATGDAGRAVRAGPRQRGVPAAVLGPAGGAAVAPWARWSTSPSRPCREAHEGNLALALGEP